jgi:hypothetical protein
MHRTKPKNDMNVLTTSSLMKSYSFISVTRHYALDLASKCVSLNAEALKAVVTYSETHHSSDKNILTFIHTSFQDTSRHTPYLMTLKLCNFRVTHFSKNNKCSFFHSERLLSTFMIDNPVCVCVCVTTYSIPNCTVPSGT